MDNSLRWLVDDRRKIAAVGGGGIVAFDVLASISVWAPLLLLLGIVVLIVVAVAWKTLRADRRIIALFVGVLFLALGLAPMLSPAAGPSGGGVVPPGGYVPQWEILVPSTVQGVPRDTAAEIFDTQGFTACGSITGQGTLTLDVSGTNMFVDRSNKLIRIGITRNTALATSAAGFQAPDCHSNDFSFRLTNPQDANGDGVMDSVSFFGRVRSVSATVTEDGNGSSSRRNIMYFDTTAGWYIGWTRRVDTQATDGQWVSACPPGVRDAELPTAPLSGCLDWQNLGATAGVDEDYIAFALVPRNYGWFGYTLPAAGFTYNIILDLGTPASYQTWTVQVYLSSG